MEVWLTRLKKFAFTYFITVGDAASTLLNATVFFSRDGNQSLSGRCFEQREHWFFGTLRHIIDFGFAVWLPLGFGEKNHCEKAFVRDGRRGKIMSIKVQRYLDSEEYADKRRKHGDYL